MTSSIKFSASFHHAALTALLVTAGANTMAQVTLSPATSPSSPTESRVGQHDPVKMQALMAKRQAELKASLKITPAQEVAWATYTAAMQPPAGMQAGHGPGKNADMDKLTTPERIDKMREIRAQRMTDMNASMNKRGDATKALNTALTPEQQKVFDAREPQHLGHGRRGGSNHQGARG